MTKLRQITVLATTSLLLSSGCRHLSAPYWQAPPAGPTASAHSRATTMPLAPAQNPATTESRQSNDGSAYAPYEPSPNQRFQNSQSGAGTNPSGGTPYGTPYGEARADANASATGDPFGDRRGSQEFAGGGQRGGQRTVRGQAPTYDSPVSPYAAGSNNQYRTPMPASEFRSASAPQQEYAPAVYAEGATPAVQPVQFTAPGPGNPFLPPPPAGLIEGVTDPAGLLGPMGPTVPLDINVAETRTGRFMFGAGVNSDLGVTGQISIDERNFDIWRPPTSWDDFTSGRAWRGGGQGLRLEAMPGSQVQRYMASLTEPYLFDTNVSLNLSGYFFDRRYQDWDEQRLGGRVALGYRLTPDLSASAAIRMENVNIHDPTFLIPELTQVLGDNSLFSGRVTLAHDTRDTPFFPTEGHYIELAYEQVFGSFDYPRFEAELRKYYLLRQRPDGSGRHTMAYSFRVGISGEETPIFENYFAGGFSTMRGFDFRGASPVNGGVQVGGEFRFLGSMEYLFPLTADDMVKGVLFCDFGTVEERPAIHSEDYRVAPGFGLRIAIPALGPAPLALDFAVPVAHENTDDIQNFSFYFGMGRS